jgi:glucose/arabinose dehydrogenase
MTLKGSGRTGVRRTAALMASLASLLVVAGPASAQVGRTDPTVELQVLTEGYRDITALEVAPDGRVIFSQREGKIFVWHQDGTVAEAAFLPVDAYDRSQGSQNGATATCPRGDECPAGYFLSEGGVHGLLLAPDFMETGHIYVYYTVADSLGQPVDPPKMPGARGPDETEGKFRLSRFTLVGDTLDLSSEVKLFENPAEWFYCCHYGGDMEWLPDGTLVLTTGDDTSSDFSNGYSPHDQRPNMTWNSADLTAQNLADRRGKVLRIDVRDVDGDESMIPKDNPFLNTPGADPYVYAYGFRSPYRMEVNTETGHIYVGNVSSDAAYPDPRRGPAGHEELEIIPPGGGTNHGWPRCTMNNVPYNRYDFAAGVAGEPFDCTGMTPAAFWYTIVPSPTSVWAQVGGGGRTIMGGTLYRRPETGALRLPEQFDNQLMWMEYSRDQIWRTPVNANGSLSTGVQDLVPVWYGGLLSPVDSEIGPDGALYIAEYGSNIWNSTNGRISRLICEGCTPSSDDYLGAPFVDPDTTQLVAGAVADNGGDVPVPMLAMILGGLVVVGLRRRRQIG